MVAGYDQSNVHTQYRIELDYEASDSVQFRLDIVEGTFPVPTLRMDGVLIAPSTLTDPITLQSMETRTVTFTSTGGVNDLPSPSCWRRKPGPDSPAALCVLSNQFTGFVRTITVTLYRRPDATLKVIRWVRRRRRISDADDHRLSPAMSKTVYNYTYTCMNTAVRDCPYIALLLRTSDGNATVKIDGENGTTCYQPGTALFSGEATPSGELVGADQTTTAASTCANGPETAEAWVGAASKMSKPAWYNAARRRSLLTQLPSTVDLAPDENSATDGTCASNFGSYIGTAMKTAKYEPAHAWNPADAGVVMTGGETWESETSLYYKGTEQDQLSGDVGLSPGETKTVKIEVTGADGVTKRHYTLEVTRPLSTSTVFNSLVINGNATGTNNMLHERPVTVQNPVLGQMSYVHTGAPPLSGHPTAKPPPSQPRGDPAT